MTIANAVLQQEAACIPARRKCPLLKVDNTIRCSRLIAFDSHLPTASPTRPAGRSQITTEIDQAGTTALLSRERRAAIDRVLLANAAQVYFHSQRHFEDRPLPGHPVPSDQAQNILHAFFARNPVPAIEAPDAPKHAGCDIETMLAKPVKCYGKIQQVRGFIKKYSRSPLLAIHQIVTKSHPLALWLTLPAVKRDNRAVLQMARANVEYPRPLVYCVDPII